MNLERKKLHTNQEKGRAFSQITLEEDYNLPDYKPDFMRLILEKGEVVFTEQQVEEGHIRIQGSLRFEILYRSDQEGRKVQVLKGEIPFQERQNLEGAKEFDEVRMEGHIEDISVRVINSRKLSVRALLELTAVLEEQKEQELLIGISDPQEYELETEKESLMELLTCKRDHYRFDRQIMLPSNKPNIDEILWKNVQLRNIDTKTEQGSLQIRGEILLAVVYAGEGEDDRIQYFESSVPFQEIMEFPEAEEDAILWVPMKLMDYTVEEKTDEDGENRQIHVELVVALDMQLWEEQEISYIHDLYSLGKTVLPKWESFTGMQFIFANRTRNKLAETVELEEEEGHLLQILSQSALLHIEEQTREEKGLMVEGTLEVKYLYLTGEENMPMLSGKLFLPFHQLVEADDLKLDDRCLVDAGIEQLSVIPADSRNLDVRCTIWIRLLVLREKQIPVITEIEEKELDYEALEKSPGIVGYLVKEGDRLFAIAKENHTTVPELMEMNQLESPVLHQGDRILMIKRVQMDM